MGSGGIGLVQQTAPRLQWLDALKGFVMLVVVWSHSMAAPYAGAVGYWFIACYMAVFFFASGMTFHPGGSLGQVAAKRARRLLVPHYLYGAALVLLDLCNIWIKGRENPEAGRKFFGLLYSRYYLYPDGTPNNPQLLPCRDGTLWFLTAMFCASLLAWVYFRLRRRRARVLLVVGYLGATLALDFLPVLLPWSLDTAFLAALLILAGHGWAAVRGRLAPGAKWVLLAVCFAAYTAATLVNTGVNLSIRRYGYDGPASWPSCGVICLAGSLCFALLFELVPLGRVEKALAWIGRHSMPFLCTQLFFLELFYSIGSKVCANDLITGWISVVGAAGCAAGVAVVFDRLGRRWGVFRLL